MLEAGATAPEAALALIAAAALRVLRPAALLAMVASSPASSYAALQQLADQSEMKGCRRMYLEDQNQIVIQFHLGQARGHSQP